MSQIEKRSKIEFPDNIVAGDRPLRISPGEYEAICIKAETGVSFGGRKDLYLRFLIIKGIYTGTELFMAIPNPKKNASYRTKYYDQWKLAMGRCPQKGELLTREAFLNKEFLILVRDTNKKYSGMNKKQPDHCQYSVVDTIMEPLTGEGSFDD